MASSHTSENLGKLESILIAATVADTIGHKVYFHVLTGPMPSTQLTGEHAEMRETRIVHGV